MNKPEKDFKMDKSYDLKLPEWGPYNKKYLGASHIAGKTAGLRFDLALFPGYYRRKVMLPRDLMDSGAKMLASSADVSHFVYRYELEWKDRVFVDADYSSNNNVLTVVCDVRNNTDLSESITLNACMSMHSCSQNHIELRPYRAKAGESLWIDALDYCDIRCAQSLACDGLYLGEERGSGFVGGSFLNGNYFRDGSHYVKYAFPKRNAEKIGIRYRGGGKIKITLGGRGLELVLPHSEDIVYRIFDGLDSLCSEMEISSIEGGPMLDGFVIGADCDKADFVPEFDGFSPRVTDVGEGKLEIAFGDLKYALETDFGEYVVRRIISDDAGQTLSDKIHDHVGTVLRGRGSKETVDLFMRPIFVEPHSSEKITIKISAISERNKESFAANREIYCPKFNPEGERYLFSQRTMAAVTLTNVVYPIYSRRGYIRHNTPGRNWDSLYTWDSGFIGLGLSAIDINRAKDCLNAYLTPVGDMHSPCIFHGTPLPIQIFLYAEIFARTEDLDFLGEFYPALKQQYDFFSRMKYDEHGAGTGIFSLWHVFYNSGGWDDYPPQKYVHENGLTGSVKPIINTAITVLCAKILENSAKLLGEDTSCFEEDIKFYSDAINKYAYDEESGYYGYVIESENPSILRVDGVNANMGLDGAYPYIAGITDGRRSDRIIENIKRGLMTEIGLGVVDRRAPYYSESGYWNGSVWMPHQWIVWKALLDHGELALANEIALTALDLWKRETDYTYNCYEHFTVKNGRGAGFHQFSGLSTPVLLWGEAYFKPQSISCGFLSTVTEKFFSDHEVTFRFRGRGTVLVCLDEGYDYEFFSSGRLERVNRGTWALTFECESDERVVVRRTE